MSELIQVVCEQKNCAGIGQDEQFYCVKCDMEICSVCRFEHMKGYSLSGLECDNELCRGNKADVMGVELDKVVDERKEKFDEDDFAKNGFGSDLGFLNASEMKEIQDLYGKDMDIDGLQGFSWNYMPDDLKEIIVKAKKRSLGLVEPKKFMTKADGNVCYYCGSDLIEIAKNIFDCSLANKDAKNGKSVFSNCRTFKNVSKIDIDKDREVLNGMINKRVYPCRNSEEGYIRQMLMENKDRLITAPNYQFTEVTIETKVTFEKEIDKKLGKPIPPVLICSNLLDEFIEKLPPNYKVFKIEDIGFGLFKGGCDCEKDFFGGRLIEHGGDYTKEQIWEKQCKVHWFEMHLQRIDSVVEEKMLKFFTQTRFAELRIKPYKVDEIYRLFVGDFDRNGKRFVINRAKRLAKDDKIEVNVHGFGFAEDRYDERNKTQYRYVGNATTLNNYRARNDNAVKVENFDDMRHAYNESKNKWSIPPSPTFAGIPKSAEELEKDIKHYKSFWTKLQKKYPEYGDSIYVNWYDGELLFYSKNPNMKGKPCKCGRSRIDCKKARVCVFDGFDYPRGSTHHEHPSW